MYGLIFINPVFVFDLGNGEIQWCFSQVKGTLEDDVTEGKYRRIYMFKKITRFIFVFTADLISCVEFNHDGELLATGDKGGRVVIFQRDPMVSNSNMIR